MLDCMQRLPRSVCFHPPGRCSRRKHIQLLLVLHRRYRSKGDGWWYFWSRVLPCRHIYVLECFGGKSLCVHLRRPPTATITASHSAIAAATIAASTIAATTIAASHSAIASAISATFRFALPAAVVFAIAAAFRFALAAATAFASAAAFAVRITHVHRIRIDGPRGRFLCDAKHRKPVPSIRQRRLRHERRHHSHPPTRRSVVHLRYQSNEHTLLRSRRGDGNRVDGGMHAGVGLRGAKPDRRKSACLPLLLAKRLRRGFGNESTAVLELAEWQCRRRQPLHLVGAALPNRHLATRVFVCLSEDARSFLRNHLRRRAVDPAQPTAAYASLRPLDVHYLQYDGGRTSLLPRARIKSEQA